MKIEICAEVCGNYFPYPPAKCLYVGMRPRLPPTSTGSIHGVVSDGSGQATQGANVAVFSAAGVLRKKHHRR